MLIVRSESEFIQMSSTQKPDSHYAAIIIYICYLCAHTTIPLIIEIRATGGRRKEKKQNK